LKPDLSKRTRTLLSLFRSSFKIQHPNISSILGYTDLFEENPCLISCSPTHKTLLSILENQATSGPCLAWDLRLKIAWQITEAAVYFHRFLNRDLQNWAVNLKSRCIFLEECFNAKVAVMGLIEPLIEEQDIIEGADLDSEPTDRLVVYSLGIIFGELLTGKPPVIKQSGARPIFLGKYLHESVAITDQSSTSSSIPSLNLSFVDKHLPDSPSEDDISSFASLMRSCLETEPGNRPTLEEVSQRIRALRERKDTKNANCLFCKTQLKEGNVAKLTCGHSVLCKDCSIRFKERGMFCPACQQPISIEI
jgi:hypothetical protein